MIKLIGISGKISSGKDQVGEYIQELVEDFKIKKFAYKLKLITSILTGIPVEDLEKREVKDSFLGPEWNYVFASGIEQQMTVRVFMQKLGTEGLREGVHKNIWVNALFSDYTPGEGWIITDTRFPNEAEAIKNRGGIIIRVNRPGISSGDHPSETSLDEWEFDHVITNDSTLEDLKQKVSDCLNIFKIMTN